MVRSKTRQRWLNEPFDAPRVKTVQWDGCRSLTSRKRLKIQGRDCISHPAMIVVHLGAVAGGHSLDLVISDMVPNMSQYEWGEGCRPFARDAVCATRVLRPLGNFPIKIFQSEGFAACREQVRTLFDSEQMRRLQSAREQYLLACGLRGA